MANEQNLIDLRTRTKEERQQIGSKGGKVKSINKKVAARLRELKKKGLESESAKLMMSMMENEEITELEILNYMKKYEQKCKESDGGMKMSHYSALFYMLKDWHKLKYGEKQRIKSEIDITSRNININIVPYQDKNGDQLGDESKTTTGS